MSAPPTGLMGGFGAGKAVDAEVTSLLTSVKGDVEKVCVSLSTIRRGGGSCVHLMGVCLSSAAGITHTKHASKCVFIG